MKYLSIILLSLILSACASHDSDRNPASEETIEQGINAESYNMNR